YPVNPQNELYLRARGERTAIKTIGSVAGLCVIGYVLLQNLVALPVGLIPPLANLYKNSDEFFYLYLLFSSVFAMMVPFVVGGLYLKKKTGTEIFCFDAPDDITLAVPAVPMGMLICIIGNYLTMLFLTGMEKVGFSLTSPDLGTPETFTGKTLYLLAIGIIPPLTEELAIRGCIMQPLRRYGDRFAIFASSLLFAILHGNLVQAPFAFIAGLGLGYICCMTGSLWPSIIIHCLNNSYSVAEELITNEVANEKIRYIILHGSEAALIGAGAVGTLFFIWYLKGRRLNKANTVLKNGAKTTAFLINIPMIIAMIIMLIITAGYVALTK
ncbi:MAG: CPBP family intramembrane metalloprotease, partial [Clostridia bacterium]|nr:CPBP family intramembrane metalloprotease [Clostridia bacterium]